MPGWVSGPNRNLLSPGGVFLRLTGVRIDIFCKWYRLKRKVVESTVMSGVIYICKNHVSAGTFKQKRRNRFCIYLTGAQTFLKSILENVEKVFILPIVSSQQVDQVFQGFHLIEFEGGFHSGIPGLGVHL